jgi:hypothetical protein
VKPNVAEPVDVSKPGPEVMVTTGARVSTRTVRETDATDELPAASVAVAE